MIGKTCELPVNRLDDFMELYENYDNTTGLFPNGGVEGR